MNNDIIEFNGIFYGHVEMTPEKFSADVKKFAKRLLSKNDFRVFELFDLDKKYCELLQYEELYWTMLDLFDNRSDVHDLCEYIEDKFDNIGEIIEPVQQD